MPNKKVKCAKCGKEVSEFAAVLIEGKHHCDDCYYRNKGYVEVYRDNFRLFKDLTKEEKERFKKHDIHKTFPVWLCIVLHFITFGIFTLIYFGLKHGKLPKVSDEDPSTGQAIGFMFIPFFNIYWNFIYWLRLTDRINLQYMLRGEEKPIPRVFVKTMLILGVIPYIWYVSIFILEPIVIGIIQSASNKLAK